jgi:predicted TIM-barrel fold metal-dependent hydrolase
MLVRFLAARLAAGLLLTATAASVATAQAPAPPPFRPLVDYHQHLASPEGARLLNRAQPEVALPPALASVTQRMVAHWNQPDALVELYAEDAVVFANLDKPLSPWIKGREKTAHYIGGLYGRPYRITPVLYSVDGDRARIEGFFTRGEGDDARHFANFHFDLIKDGDGAWRILTDMRSFEPKPDYQPTISGEQLTAMLDAAGVHQAVVLSDAYWFDAPSYMTPGETPAQAYAQVRAENDWTADQAAKSNGRLVALCSFNPLAGYALDELRRCKAAGFSGLKLHLQTSGVDLTRPDQAARVRAVFALADKLRLPIVVHAQTFDNYGAEAARIFLDQLLSAAPDIPVTIAHLWGGGPLAAEALAVYVEAAAAHRPATRNLYFDVAEAALVANRDPKMVQTIADAIRRIGPDHVVFGSDAVGPNTLTPIKAAAQFRRDIPLSDAEFATIERNVLPYRGLQPAPAD